MSSGGARARSGPAPDPNALTAEKVRKSAASGEWVTLPKEGRSGAAPKWPLVRAKPPTKDELAQIERLVEQIDGAAPDDNTSSWERTLRRLDAKVQAYETQKRELVVWRDMWKTPQAIAWKLLGLEYEVALHVRSLVAAEDLGASVASRTLIRQQQEALGLSLPGLARNRWTIGDLAAEAKPQTTAAATAARAGARDRFAVIPGGGQT